MRGYARKWNCRICRESQDTIDKPQTIVCDDCLLLVAERLCGIGLGLPLNTMGVDEAYWLRQARYVVAPLMTRWKEPS